MSHWVSEHKGGDFERPPVGVQPAVAARVYDLGYQPGYKGGKPQHKYTVLWELAARITKGELAGKRHTVTKIYSASLGSAEMPSKLRKDLVSWRTRQFTAEELQKFDLDVIIGKNCSLSLVEQMKDGGKKWIDIAAVLPAIKGVERLTPETSADFIPDWVQEMIDNQIPADSVSAYENVTTPASGGPGVAEDDIPF